MSAMCGWSQAPGGSSSVNIVSTPNQEAYCRNTEVSLHAEVEVSVTYIMPGDILCTDGSIEKLADWPVEGKEAMGIVFYVDATDQHGWAVSLNSQQSGGQYKMRWSTDETEDLDIPNCQHWLDGANDIDGFNNTQIMRNAGGPTEYPAAYAVDFENGWYLPAEGQLNILFSELLVVNASLQQVAGESGVISITSSDSHFWSSTEAAANYAMTLIFGGIQQLGRVGYERKIVKKAVRQIRDF